MPSAVPARAGPGWEAAATATTAAAAATEVASTATARDSTARACNVADLRELARRTLPKSLFEFVDRGSRSELALRTLRAALERVLFCPRVLVDVSQRSQERGRQKASKRSRRAVKPKVRKPSTASAVFHAVQHLRRPMDLPSWLGANHSDAQWHRADLQRRQGGKDAVLCAA